MISRHHCQVARGFFLKGHSLVLKGESKRAELYFDRGIDRDSSAAYALFYRAGLRILRGADSLALRDLNALLDLGVDTYVRYREFEIPSPVTYPKFEEKLNHFVEKQKNPFRFVLRAFCHRSALRYKEAIADMESAVKLAPKNAGLLAILARVRFVNRLPVETLSDLSRAIQIAPNCGWIRAWRAETFRHHGRLNQGLKESNLAIQLDPSYFRAYAWRGGILRQKGLYQEAINDFNQALSVDAPYWWGLDRSERHADPNFAWLLNEKSLALRALGRTDEALVLLNRAHRLNSRYGWAWNSNRNAPTYTNAESELSKLISRQSGQAWAYAWRGWTRLESGNPVAALSDLELATKRLPSESWPWLWRAKAEAAIGKQKEAIIHCRRSCQCDPLYGPARAWLGGLLRSNSQYPAALISLDRALKIDPILAWAWAWRGEVLLRMGKVVDSLDSLRNALALDPMNSDAALWQAEGFAASGHYAAAEKFALKVIQVWPSHWRALALLSVLAGRSKRVKRQKYYLNRAFNAAPLHMKKHIEMQSHIHG